MIKTFWKKHKHTIIHEIGSWLSLIISFIATDGVDILTKLYDGDFSDATVLALRFLIVRSIVKALLIKFIPSLFPLYRKDVGILPAAPKVEEPREEL